MNLNSKKVQRMERFYPRALDHSNSPRFPDQSKNDSLDGGSIIQSPNNVTDLISCYICFGKVKNAVLCPHCSKLCCEQCIKVFFIEFDRM